MSDTLSKIQRAERALAKLKALQDDPAGFTETKNRRERDTATLENFDISKAQPTDPKTCGTCRVEKTRADFPAQKSSRDELSYRCLACRKIQKDAWHAKHKEEQNRISREYAEVHAKEISDRQKQYRQDNPEHIRELAKKFNKKHEERLRKQRMTPAHRLKMKANHRKWRRENPGKSQEKCRREQARRWYAAKTNRISYDLIYDRDKGICYLCYKPSERKTTHFDHVIPLIKGGDHSYENVRVTHGPCNLRKGDKIVQPGAYADTD